jgi:hypothetical protein
MPEDTRCFKGTSTGVVGRGDGGRVEEDGVVGGGVEMVADVKSRTEMGVSAG